MAKQVVITMKDGLMHVEAEGYSGNGCAQEIQDLLEAVDGEELSQEFKDEYYETENTDDVKEFE
jgi:hypothetical protein